MASDKTKVKIEDALERLRRKTPQRTDGKFTASNLAAEAGIGRATLYRYPEYLKALEEAGPLVIKGVPTTPSEMIAYLEGKVREHQKEVEELRSQRKEREAHFKQQIDILVQHIQALALTVKEQRKTIEKLREAPGAEGGDGVIVAFDPRGRNRKGDEP